MISLDLRLEGLESVDRALAQLDPMPAATLLEGLARMVQEQTRRRIESETTSPSGAAWKPNRTGTPILVRSGALQRSVDYAVTGTEAIVGSGLVYARIQQKGGTIKPKTARRLVFRLGNRIVFAPKVTLPARPYLGLSPENREDILDQVGRFLRARIGGGA